MSYFKFVTLMFRPMRREPGRQTVVAVRRTNPDKEEGGLAGRLASWAGLLAHELAERVKRRLKRQRVESQLDAIKTLASFEFAEVPMLTSWCWPLEISGLRKGPTFRSPVAREHVHDGLWHSQAIFEEGAEIAHRAQLQRKAQAKTSTTAPQNQSTASIIEIEIARQIVW